MKALISVLFLLNSLQSFAMPNGFMESLNSEDQAELVLVSSRSGNEAIFDCKCNSSYEEGPRVSGTISEVKRTCSSLNRTQREKQYYNKGFCKDGIPNACGGYETFRFVFIPGDCRKIN